MGRRRTFKIYYTYGTGQTTETQFCCETMKDLWKSGEVWFVSDDLEVLAGGFRINYCLNCGAKIIIKESRL